MLSVFVLHDKKGPTGGLIMIRVDRPFRELGPRRRAPSMYANLVLVQGRNPESLRSKDGMHCERTVMLVGNIDALQ